MRATIMSETTPNSGYGSSEETASLIVRSPPSTVRSSGAGNPSSSGGGGGQSSGKPVLTRQDCTTSLVPHHYRDLRNATNTLGSSDESGPPNDATAAARSVPDIELHCRYLAVNRCQCQRRKSHCISRSVSRESVRIGGGVGNVGGGSGGGGGGSGNVPGVPGVPVGYGGYGGYGSAGGCVGSAYGLSPPPPVLLTTSPSSRIIRQSSQPEATGSVSMCSGHCCHIHHQPSSSLRQLRDPADNIAMIAADSLRINGAIRQFRQVRRILPIDFLQFSISEFIRMTVWNHANGTPVVLIIFIALTATDHIFVHFFDSDCCDLAWSMTPSSFQRCILHFKRRRSYSRIYFKNRISGFHSF